MSKKALPPILERLLDELNGPPTAAYLGEIQEAAKAIAHKEKLQKANSAPRRPEVNDWIRKQLVADPTLKRPELWERAPLWIKEQIGVDRFNERVTQVRQGR